MKYLYLWLDLGSFIIPFIFSFHPRLKFYKKWGSLAIGIAVMMLIFIPWDIVFTQQKIWGFNEAYLSGYYLFNLPIEEWLFFICIPYACIFTHHSLTTLMPKFKFSEGITNIIYVSLASILVVTLWYFYDHWYTFICFVFAIIILGIVKNNRPQLLPHFFATYCVILIPFFLVNGILTGTGIEDQVVWYNNNENLGIRMGTIPLDDTIYNLGMLLSVLFVTETLEERKIQPNSRSHS